LPQKPPGKTPLGPGFPLKSPFPNKSLFLPKAFNRGKSSQRRTPKRAQIKGPKNFKVKEPQLPQNSLFTCFPTLRNLIGVKKAL